MKKYIFILLIATGLFSCDVDAFLDEKPTGTLIPESVEHFDKLLEDYKISNPTWNNLAFRDPDTYMPGKNYTDLGAIAKRQYQWSQTPYTVEDDDSDWVYKYESIYVYNLILNEINDAPLGNTTEADRKRVKGEAFAMRAMDYFLLVNEYAPHISSSTLDAPAIPMPLKNDLTVKLPRSTVGEVYDRIVSDLTAAEILLDDAPNHNEKANFRPGKAAMKALFAAVHLYAGNFEEAKNLSDEALSMYDFVYDFTELTNYYVGEAWSGLSINDFDYSTNAKSVLWNRYHRWGYNGNAQLYHPDLLALFDQDNDQRFILFSASENYFGVDVSPNFCYARRNAETQSGMTVPNLILINAEAKARTGDDEGALTALNSLLEKRIFNFEPLTTANTSDVLQTVKNERRKELMATGMNWVDLKRYHAYGETIPTYTRTVEGQTFTLAPGSQEYVVPVSAKIKSFNPNL